jgi:hypothetical protein
LIGCAVTADRANLQVLDREQYKKSMLEKLIWIRWDA